MAVIRRIVLPQDQRIVMAGGTLNPAWYRFFVALQQQFPELISLAEQADTADDTLATLDSRVGSLERNFLKDPLESVDESLLTISATYDQVEVQAVATRVEAHSVTLNQIIERLETSNIVRTE